MPLISGGGGGSAFNGGTITQPLFLASPHSTSDTADLLKASASNLANIFSLFTSGDGQHTLAEDGANFIYVSNGADNPGEILRVREYDVRFRDATDSGNLLFVDRAGNKLGFFNHAAAAQQTLTSGTATPEQIVLALQASGFCGGS